MLKRQRDFLRVKACVAFRETLRLTETEVSERWRCRQRPRDSTVLLDEERTQTPDFLHPTSVSEWLIVGCRLREFKPRRYHLEFSFTGETVAAHSWVTDHLVCMLSPPHPHLHCLRCLQKPSTPAPPQHSRSPSHHLLVDSAAVSLPSRPRNLLLCHAIVVVKHKSSSAFWNLLTQRASWFLPVDLFYLVFSRGVSADSCSPSASTQTHPVCFLFLPSYPSRPQADALTRHLNSTFTVYACTIFMTFTISATLSSQFGAHHYLKVFNSPVGFFPMALGTKEEARVATLFFAPWPLYHQTLWFLTSVPHAQLFSYAQHLIFLCIWTNVSYSWISSLSRHVFIAGFSLDLGLNTSILSEQIQ